MTINKNSPWTLTELIKLKQLIQDGKNVRECAKATGRSVDSISGIRSTYGLPKFKSKISLKTQMLEQLNTTEVIDTKPKVIAKNPNVFEPVLTAPKPTTESTGSLVELLIQSAKEKNLKVTITFESYPL